MSKDALTLSSDATDNEPLNTEHFDPVGDAKAALEEMRGTGEKFRLTDLGKENYFLPPYEKCCHYLLEGFSLRKGIELVEQTSNRPLSIGRSSRSALFNPTGVGYPTAKKFTDWIAPSIEEFFSLWDKPTIALYKNTAKLGSNAATWIAGIASIRLSQSFQQGEFQEYVPQFEFLEERCSADAELVGSVREKIKAGELNKSDTVAILQEMRPVWQQHSLVPLSQWQAFEEGGALHAANGVLSNDEKTSFVSGFFGLYFDFYFHLFASYEVGCVLTYTEDRSDLKAKKGILCRAINSYVENEGAVTCLGELLDEIRDAYSKKYKPTSKRAMAQFIPIESNPNDPPAESKADRHYKALKSWRNGKETPSVALLEGFFGNLTKDIGSSFYMLVLLCQMAIGIDKAKTYWMQQLEKEVANSRPLEIAFFECMSRYELYYQHHLDKQLKKAARV